MYQIVKTLIESGGFGLTDMCSRIEVLFARGRLTEEESAELIDMAREHVEMAVAIRNDVTRLVTSGACTEPPDGGADDEEGDEQ